MSSLLMDARGNFKVGSRSNIDLIQNHVESLSSKMDKLMTIQNKVLSRLDGMSKVSGGIENDKVSLKTDKKEIHLPAAVPNQTQVIGQEMKELCQEMSTIMLAVNQRSEQQAQKLEGMEKLVLSMQQVITFIGETVKSSRVMERIFKRPTARKGSKPKDNKGKPPTKRKSSTDAITKKPDQKTTSNKANRLKAQEISPACEVNIADLKIKLHGLKHFLASRKYGNFLTDHKGKDGTEKPCLNLKDLKAEEKIKPLDTTDQITLKKQALILEEVQKLNKENTQKTQALTPAFPDVEAGVSPEYQQGDSSECNLVDYLQEVDVAEKEELAKEVAEEEEVGEKVHEGEADVNKESKDDVEEVIMKKDEKKDKDASAAEVTKAPEVPVDAQKDNLVVSDGHEGTSPSLDAEQEQKAEDSASTTLHVEEDEEEKKGDKEEESESWAVFKADGVEFQLDLKERVDRERKEHDGETEQEDDEYGEQFFIDTAPPPAAPFNHRAVSAKPNQISRFYTINWQEVLGGGRFGQVHKCVENSSGLTLAAKVIKARNQKEKEVVKNEIQVMNNLDHDNLIKLYAAYETKSDIILVLEYVGGGELFDRIIDENYTLMELDAVMFIRQICQGMQYMHNMYILHLDLKPENILCVSRATNKVKIIDFGLARKYKPREKLRVNFGTPEFLAPEVINYEFVSFNTDMWSLGVITYMLLSGLSPFLGDDDSETLNNILSCQWNFEEQEFVDISAEAKDFITRLLAFHKGGRIGASEALRHPWLSDSVLHHQLHTKKTMCKSRRASCMSTLES